MIREGFAVIFLALFSNFRKIYNATTIQFTIRVQAQLVKQKGKLLVETIYLIKCVYLIFIDTIFIQILKQNKLIPSYIYIKLRKLSNFVFYIDQEYDSNPLKNWAMKEFSIVTIW